jgi:glutamate dehydrogenase
MMVVESLDMNDTIGGKEKEQENPPIEFQETLKKAVNILNYPPQVFEFLKKPMRFLEVSIPARMGNEQTDSILRISLMMLGFHLSW